MLALPINDDCPPEVMAGFSMGLRNIEQAGEPFERYALKKLGLLESSSADEEENAEPIDTEEIDKEKLANKRKKTNKDEAMKTLVFSNHYDALSLTHLQFSATEADIRKSYKTKVLNHHPDKFEEGEYDEIAKQQWLAIQDAYETLIDPEKRRKYDSILEFDETLPGDKDYSNKEFLEIFGAIFKRNAYFSEKTPVPDLGDEKTPINKVLRFYAFWESFSSWRDFSVKDEYDLEQAENRYEKRYMERENKRMKKDLFKKEKQRISTLVALAKEKDYRLQQHLKAEREELERIKEAKKMQKQKKKDDEEKLKKDVLDKKKEKLLQEQNEIKRKEEEVKSQKLGKKNVMNEAKKLIIAKIELPEYNDLFLDYFLPGLKEEEMKELFIIFEENANGPQETLRTIFKEFIANVKNRQSGGLGKKDPNANKKKEVVQKWTVEELTLLTKALVKYPAGLNGRWEKVSDYLDNRKTPVEVNQMAKELVVKNIKNEKDIIEFIEGVKEKEKEKIVAPAETEWSQDQQKALEKAMKTYPASMEKRERWTKISEAVVGKTAKDCIERVKEIKAKLSKK